MDTERAQTIFLFVMVAVLLFVTIVMTYYTLKQCLKRYFTPNQKVIHIPDNLDEPFLDSV